MFYRYILVSGELSNHIYVVKHPLPVPQESGGSEEAQAKLPDSSLTVDPTCPNDPYDPWLPPVVESQTCCFEEDFMKSTVSSLDSLHTMAHIWCLPYNPTQPQECLILSTNRGIDCVCVFRIKHSKTLSLSRDHEHVDEKKVELELVQRISSRGEVPRHFVVLDHPEEGKLCLVANQASNNITVFKVDITNYSAPLSYVNTEDVSACEIGTPVWLEPVVTRPCPG